MKKKIVSIVCLCALLLSATACDKKTESGEKIKLTYWTDNNAPSYVSDYNDIEVYKKIEEKFNVDIEFIHPVASSAAEQFNTMIASRDYPDIIEYSWKSYPGGVKGAIDDEVILEITDLVEKNAPNFTKLMNSRDDYKKIYQSVRGNMGGFGTLKSDLSPNACYGPTIRQDWLEKLGLDTPETADDWYKVLTAFKNEDPNGNGKKDEIPLVADKEMSFLTLSSGWGVLRELQLKDGKVVHGAIQPEYKEFIKEMNKWYREGLIDGEFASMTRKNTDAKVANNQAGAFVGYSGSQMGNYIKNVGDSIEGFKLSGVQWIKGKDDKIYTGYSVMNALGGLNEVAISTKNKYPEKSIEIIDFNYSEEGMVLHNWGIKDVTYTEENGSRSYTDAILKDSGNNDPIGALSKYALPIYGGTAKIMMGDAFDALSRSYSEQREAAEIWAMAGTDILLPRNLSFNEEETKIISKYSANISTLINEKVTKMIMGVEPVEAFDDFVKQMKSMGVDEMTEAYQNAYDRYTNN